MVEQTQLSHDIRHVGGINVHIYGLSQLDKDTQYEHLYVLYLAHGRLQDYTKSEQLAHQLIPRIKSDKPLIAVAIDLRNHGERLVDAERNHDFTEGNRSHLVDMVTIIEGSILDFQLVHDHLPICLSEYKFGNLESILVGISLGAHMSWRLATKLNVLGIVCIIGTPYLKPLFYDRIWDQIYSHTDMTRQEFDEMAFNRAIPEDILPHLLAKRLSVSDDATRRVLSNPEIGILCGKKDTLVPAAYSYKWWDDNQWRLSKDKRPEMFIDEDAGHEVTERMVDESARLLTKWLNKN